MSQIKSRLSQACCALLGVTSAAPAETEPWIIDFGLMNYIEKDRNTGIEAIVKGTRDTSDGGSVSVSAEVDVITGATPNGATPSNVPQTFTMASGEGSYSVDAGELPVDDTHMDTRLALKTGVNDPISENLLAEYNAMISMEFDYLSLAAGATLARDFNRKNTTLLAGFNYEYSDIHPVGDSPDEFGTMAPPDEPQPRDVSSLYKRGREISLGITQVIDRHSIFQIRLNHSNFSGYMTDPYKLLSIIEDMDPATLGATLSYIFEKRPQQRDIYSIYLGYKRSFIPGTLDLSYRLYEDDWDVKSDTLEIAYQFNLDKARFIRPSLRLYHQDAAYFYRHSLPASEELPAYASADDRLAEFGAYTLGFEIGKRLLYDRKQSLTIEYYRQQGDSSPDDAIGLQQQQDLYPGLQTLILKYVYSIQW